MTSTPDQAAFSAMAWFIVGTKYRSIALRKRIGGANSNGVTTATSPSASTTHNLYGAMYCNSRRISRESYAFPSASSSCRLLIESCSLRYRVVLGFSPRVFPLRALQFLFQQLLVIQIRV